MIKNRAINTSKNVIALWIIAFLIIGLVHIQKHRLSTREFKRYILYKNHRQAKARYLDGGRVIVD
ncbi:hypothetical protein [Butyrivibrio sp. AC2005]|uniref:hypothetical protein n=1 Tax=Butyrivibrio sp. AC2005 TaxID=1280672 RepID=UPI000401CD92|nr:hypothetical protein [Butyrivibrio sp. AC2005]